jgi:hypothetical protein
LLYSRLYLLGIAVLICSPPGPTDINTFSTFEELQLPMTIGDFVKADEIRASAPFVAK